MHPRPLQDASPDQGLTSISRFARTLAGACLVPRSPQRRRLTSNRPKPHKNVKEAEDFIEKSSRGIENGENINWGIILCGETDIIGSICLWNFSVDRKKAELGYDLNPKYQNRGIMSEALNRVLNFGFLDLNLKGKVANITSEKFVELANEAKSNCPISGVLKCKINLDALLV